MQKIVNPWDDTSLVECGTKKRDLANEKEQQYKEECKNYYDKTQGKKPTVECFLVDEAFCK